MSYKKTLNAYALAPLALALALALTSCATCRPEPEPAPSLPPIAWPILPSPDGYDIHLTDDQAGVVVPLDYWTGLVGYIRAVDDVRAILDAEGRIVQ